MSMVSFGDLAQSLLLKAQTARLKSDSMRITQELASGRLADTGQAVSGDFSRLSALAHSQTLLSGYQAAAREAAMSAQAIQGVLTLLSDSAAELVPELLIAPQDVAGERPTVSATQARDRLAAALATLNTSTGGRSLLAGEMVNGPAVTDANTILTALRATVTGATTADQALARIEAWFSAPTGFAAVAYQGGAAAADLAISPQDTAWLGVTANDPAIRAVLSGLAAAALTDDASLGLPPGESRMLARRAGESLLRADESLTTLAARVGTTEAQVDAAQVRLSSEMLTLGRAQAALIEADPYTLATELEAVSTNLEMIYAITARLTQLKLSDYLR